MDMIDICTRLEALTEAVRGIGLGLEEMSNRGVASAGPMAELPPAPSPNQRPRYLPTDWPKIGGRGDLPETGNLFVASAYRDLYREGEGREIYAGACDGLAHLASRLRMPLFKVSSCGLGRLADRMKELGRDRYASEWFRNGEYVVEQEGFDRWFPSHVYVTKPPAPNSPVTMGPRALTVRLPRTMSAEAFDLAFDAEVRKAAIHTWVMSEDGVRHCSFVSVDPAMCQRSTAYPYGSAARGSPAQEIVVFRIREDADRLANIVERVILKHLGLIL
jgi:hypothetical protein